MAYLDVNPLLLSLRAHPEEFEFTRSWLTHIPSNHSFQFQPNDAVEIRADCNCAFLAVKHEQARDLNEAFKSWLLNYWQPLQINREFATHFKPRSKLRRVLISATAKLNAWLIGHAPLAAE